MSALPPRTGDATSPRRPPSLAWMPLATALGDAVGLVAVAIVGQLVSLVAGPDVDDSAIGVLFTMLVGAGVIEGAAVGLAQTAGFGRALSREDRRRWVGATMVGMSLGWSIGGVASAFEAGPLASTASAFGVPLATLYGAVVGFFVGQFQRGATRAIARCLHPWAQAAGWAVGMTLASWITGDDAAPLLELQLPFGVDPTPIVGGLVAGTCAGGALSISLWLGRAEAAPRGAREPAGAPTGRS